MRLTGRIVLSRARKAGLSKRQAASKKLKLRAKTYRLAGTKKTVIRIQIPRRLARKILAGLKQRRKATLRVTGAAKSSTTSAPARLLRIRLKR